MDFIDRLKQFSKRVESLKDAVTTEEATKTSLIMPFFALLGYAVQKNVSSRGLSVCSDSYDG